MIKKLFYVLILLLLPSLAHASQATLVSWDTPTTCIIVSDQTVTTNCDPITGYVIYAGTSSGVYTIFTTVSVSNSAPLATISGSLPRGYICVVATTLTASSQSNYSNERCYWNLGNSIFSDNATRPVPKKPGSAGIGAFATDNFNRADVNPIAGTWTTVPGAGAMQISGSKVKGVSSGYHAIYWNANPLLSNDQCARITIVDTGSGSSGPAVRMSATQRSAYEFGNNDNGTWVYSKMVNGTPTNLGASIAGSATAGDVVTLCVRGTTLTGYVNGVAQQTRTDSDIAAGSAGIDGWGNITSVDDWAAWDGALLPFAPNQYVQAEAGTLSGMAIGVAGADTFIYAPANYTGYARFTFAVTTAGNYIMQARFNSNNDGGQNSFFVGLDNEAAQGNDTYTWDLPLVGTFTWGDVNRKGSGPTPIDPMIWYLSAGQHTFMFYGRESNTWLDQIRLVPAP